MKRDKILTFGFAALFAAGLLSSCSQEDVAAGVDLHQENNKTVTVKELTERLKVYNANVYGVTRASQEPWMPNPELSTDLKMKIVVADVKGGIRGYRHGGWLGGLIGAAVSSLVKAVADRLFGSKRVELSNPTVFIAGVAPAFSDSIGYYHNHLEGMMYNMDNNSNLLTSASLLSRADSIMLDTSTGYAAADRLNGMQKAAIAADADVVRSIDSSDMTFDEYCGKLTSLNPEDADYIDFVAEYLYVVNYANVDIAEYTEEVMFIINNANADVEDASLLNSSVQVAYASSVVANGN